MSQAGVINVAGGGGGGSPVQTLTGDSGGAVPPTGNNIFVLGGSSSVNNDNGIVSVGTPGTSTIVYNLTNRLTGTVSTTDATLTTIMTLPLGATPGTYYVSGNVQAFNSSTPAGASYGFSGAFRTTGAAAIEIATAYHDEFEEVAFVAADIFLSASGNNILVQVQGPALNVNWNSILEYRKVS